MIQPLVKIEGKSAGHAALFETPRTGTNPKIKRYPPLPFDSGTLDDLQKRNN